MINAKTRKQKACLQLAEALTSSGRDRKGEEKSQIQVPSVVSKTERSSATRKRKLGAVLDEQEIAARGTAAIEYHVQGSTQDKPSSVHDGSSEAALTVDSRPAVMGSSDLRATSHKRDRHRGISGALERARNRDIGGPDENKVILDASGREEDVFYEVKNGKRKVLGHRVRKFGTEEGGDASSDHNGAAIVDNSTSRYLNHKKMRRDVLDGKVIEGDENLAGRLTRAARTKGTAQPGTADVARIVHMKKLKQNRVKGKAETPITAEGELVTADAPIIPEGQVTRAGVPIPPVRETAKTPHMETPKSDAKLGSSDQTTTFDRDSDPKSRRPLGSPPDESGLNRVQSQVELQLLNVIKSRKNKESMVDVRVVKHRPPKSASTRITRGMKGTGSGPTGILETSSATGIGEPVDPAAVPTAVDQVAVPAAVDQVPMPAAVDQAAMPAAVDQAAMPAAVDQAAMPTAADQAAVPTAVDQEVMLEAVDQPTMPMTTAGTASRELRSHRKGDGASNLIVAERPRKQLKKKQDKPPAASVREDVIGTRANDATLGSGAANGIEGLGAIDAATSDSQMNSTELERNGNSSLSNGVTHRSPPTGGVQTRRSNVDGASGKEPLKETGSRSLVSGHAVKSIEGRVKKTNDAKDISHSEEFSNETGRKGADSGRLKKREKKHVDPGSLLNSEGHVQKMGVGCAPNKNTSEPSGNGLRQEETYQCQNTEGSGHLRPGTASKTQTDLGKQRNLVQNVDEASSVAAGQSQKPFAEMVLETGVENSVQRPVTDGGRQQVDHRHLDPKNLQRKPPNMKGKKSKTMVPGDSPSETIGVLTRGSKVDGRKYGWRANGSTKTEAGREFLGNGKMGSKEVDSLSLLKNSERFPETCGLDSAQDKASGQGNNTLADEQARQCTSVEESGRSALGPSSEVQTGTGDDRVDLQRIAGETLKAAARLEQTPELHNVRSEEKIGVEEPVKFAEIDIDDEQIDRPCQVLRKLSDEGEHDGVKHSETVIPKSLPMRIMRYATRGRKVDGQTRTEPEMQSGLQPSISGHSCHPSEGRRKKKSGVAKDSGAASELTENVQTRSHVVSKEGEAKALGLQDLFRNSEGEAEKNKVDIGSASEHIEKVQTRAQLGRPKEGVEKALGFRELFGSSEEVSEMNRVEGGSASDHTEKVQTRAQLGRAKEGVEKVFDFANSKGKAEMNRVDSGAAIEHTDKVQTRAHLGRSKEVRSKVLGFTGRPTNSEGKSKSRVDSGSASEHTEKVQTRAHLGRSKEVEAKVLGFTDRLTNSEGKTEKKRVDSGSASEHTAKFQTRSHQGRSKEVGANVLGSTGRPTNSEGKTEKSRVDIGSASDHTEKVHTRAQVGRANVLGVRDLFTNPEGQGKKDRVAADPEKMTSEAGRSGLQDEHTFERTPLLTSPELKKTHGELGEERNEVETLESAGSIKKQTELLQGEGSGDVKGTEIPTARIEKERGHQENDHHDQVLEKRSVLTQVVEEWKNPPKKTGRQAFLKTRAEVIPVNGTSLQVGRTGFLRSSREVMTVNDASVLKASMGSITVETEKVSENRGKNVRLPGKRKRKKQGIGTEDSLAVANNVSPASVDITVEGPELADKTSTGNEGRIAAKTIVKAAIAADLQPFSSNPTSDLLSNDVDVHKVPYQGRPCNGGHEDGEKQPEELSAPKRRKLRPRKEGTSKAIPKVGHSTIFFENSLALSSAQGVGAGVVQSAVGKASLFDDLVDVQLQSSQVAVSIDDSNVHKASNQEASCKSDHKSQQKLPIGTSDSITSKEIPEEVNAKDLSLEDRVIAHTAQSERVEGRAEPLKGAAEVTQNESQVEVQFTLPSSEAQGVITSGQAPTLKKKVRRKRNYVLGVEFARVTRGRRFSKVDSQGDENGTVAGALTRQHLDMSAERVVSTTENGRNSVPLEERGECGVASTSQVFRDKTGEALEHNPGQNVCMAVNSIEELVGSHQTPHVDEKRSSPKDDAVVIAVEQETNVEVMEARKSLIPESPGNDVCALKNAKNGGEPTSSLSSLSNPVDNMETPVQGELNGQLHDQPASSTANYLSDQEKNDLLSDHPETPDGQFAVEDGRSLKFHCGQENASDSIDAVPNPEVSQSLYPENSCAQDFNCFSNAQRIDSNITLDESEFLTRVETPDPDPVASTFESNPVVILPHADPVATTVESVHLVAAVFESDPVASICETNPVASRVESVPVASVVESDPVAAICESNPVAYVVESDTVGTRNESHPVASTVESEPVASTVGADAVAYIVESDSVTTTVISAPAFAVLGTDSITSAESLEPMITEDNSAEKPNSISTEIVLESIIAGGKPGGVTTVIGSDFLTTPDTSEPDTIAFQTDSITTVGNSSLPLAVVDAENTPEVCEIDSVRESIVCFTGNKTGSGESLITEAMTSQHKQLAVEVFEDCGLKDDNSTKSPVVQLVSPAEDSVEPVIENVEGFGVTPEKHGIREQKSRAEILREMASVNPQKSPFVRGQTSSQTALLEPGDLEQNLQGADTAQRQPGPVISSVIQHIANIEDCMQGASVLSESLTKGKEPVTESERSTSSQGGACAEFVPSEHPQVELADQKCTVEAPGLLGLEQCQTDRSPQERSKGALDDHDFATVGTEQGVKRFFAKSSTVAMDKKKVNCDVPTSGMEDVMVDPQQEKFSSGLQNLHQTQSDGSDRDELILKSRDVEPEDRIEVNAEVQKVHMEADNIHMQAHSKGEDLVADVEVVECEAMEGSLHGEEACLVVKKTQEIQAEVQQVQAEVQEIQVRAPEMQDQVQVVETAEEVPLKLLSGEHVHVDTEGKESGTEAKGVPVEAKEVYSESEVRFEVREVDTEHEADAEALHTVDDKTTTTSEHNKEKVLGLHTLETSSSPHTSGVPLDAEKHIQLAEQVLCTPLSHEDTMQSGQPASPVEGDLLQPEDLSDTQMDTHEKDYAKSQSLRSEDPVSQKSTVKASLLSKKRKGRFGSEVNKDVVGHEGGDRDQDPPTRVFSQKKGFLLASTSIESGGMRIRPRPLDPDQSIPILVEGHDKDFYEYDGGSFYRWVQQQEETKFKKPAVDHAADGVSEGGGSSALSKTYLVKRRPIFIPLFRKLPNHLETISTNGKRLDEDVTLSPFPRPTAYVRHTKSGARILGHALGCSFSTVPSVYDMDDEDEEWLQGYNETLEQSGQSHLSDDTFEELMELFEREFYRISQISSNSAVLPRSFNEKGGASGHREKRSDVESSQRHFRMEATREGVRFSRSLELFEGALSQKEIERRFTVQNGSEDCCICNGGENSDFNPVRRCQICSINVHESCYGICGPEGGEFGHHAEIPNWCCRKCEAVVGGRALPSISCAICCKSGGAMKPTVDSSRWAHVACALYTNETFFVDPEAMEPVDGLAAVEVRVKKQRERCGLCGAREGSCVRCSTRGCRAPFHISCGVSHGASFELRHTKQLVVGVRSFCPRHASFVPGANLDDIQCAQNIRVGDAAEVLPAVSTESSDTLEMRHVEQRNPGEKGNGIEDAMRNVAAWQGSLTKNADLDRSESKRYSRRKRTGARPKVTGAGEATPSNLDASSREHEVSEKDVHGVSRTLPRSGSMLKETMQGVSQYMDETDPSIHPTAEEKLESEGVSGALADCPSHLASSFENVNHIGKVTSTIDEAVAIHKSVAGDPDTSSLVDKAVSDSVSLELPSLETLDTDLATPQIVTAVYSFWQSKRVKAKGPMLHDLRQHQAARSQGIFNKVVHRSSECLPAVGHDSPARLPITRRPRSLGTRDPVASRFSELRQQLEILRSIAGNVVRREQLKLEDQRLLYESAQQRLLIAREAPKSRRCLWCENTHNLLNCSSCLKAFCFLCFKHRKGYGVKGWIAASKQAKYVCTFCLVPSAQEKSWPESDTNLLPSTLSEPRGTPVSRVALVPGRLGDWNHGLEVRTKPNSGKQVSFLNETTWKGEPRSNPIGSCSSTQEAVAAYTKSAAPSMIESSRAVHMAYQDGVLSSGANEPADGEDGRVQTDHSQGDGKRVKRRRAKSLKKQTETVLRATKRIKKLARSSSFVYGSEDETVSESDESRTDKKTVKLSDLRDKGAKNQRTKLLEAGGEGKNREKGHPPLKFGIKFSSGKLIFTRHGPPLHP